MPELILKLGDNIIQKYFFVKETMHIGRTPENEIVIENLAVSRTHATIHFEAERYILTDMGSSNGSHVNGVRVEKIELNDRDVITIGKHQLFFYDKPGSEKARRPSMADADMTMMVEMTLRASVEVIKGRQKGQRFDLGDVPTRIGRGGDNDIRLSDWFVSKAHVVIEPCESGYRARDLGSWRNTKVNGKIIREGRLQNGDVIELGPTVQLVFRVEPVLGSASSSFPSSQSEADVLRPTLGPSSPEQAPARPSLSAIKVQPLFEESPPETGPAQEEMEALAQKEEPPEEAAEEAFGQPPSQTEKVDEADAVEDVGEAADEAQEPAEAAPATPSGPAEAADQAQPVETAKPVEPAGVDVPEAEPQSTTQSSNDEIRLWERALTNKSEIIRRQAARRLKQLTGKDYEY